MSVSVPTCRCLALTNREHADESVDNCILGLDMQDGIKCIFYLHCNQDAVEGQVPEVADQQI